MKKSFVVSGLLASAIALVSAPTSAAERFGTPLSGSQEVPPVTTTGSGQGLLILSDDSNSIDVMLSWMDLTAPAVAAHVHCCALAGASAPVAIGFMPPNLATGSLSGTFDLTSAATYTSGFLNANGGTAASAQTAFLTGLRANKAYFNVHSSAFPGGEVRGQIAAVPEPATWALMILGFGMVGAAGRSRRRGSAVSFG